jgi:hypothetical protein
VTAGRVGADTCEGGPGHGEDAGGLHGGWQQASTYSTVDSRGV